MNERMVRALRAVADLLDGQDVPDVMVNFWERHDRDSVFIQVLLLDDEELIEQRPVRLTVEQRTRTVDQLAQQAGLKPALRDATSRRIYDAYGPWRGHRLTISTSLPGPYPEVA